MTPLSWEVYLAFLWKGNGGGGHGHRPLHFFCKRGREGIKTLLFCGDEKAVVMAICQPPLLLEKERSNGHGTPF